MRWLYVLTLVSILLVPIFAAFAQGGAPSYVVIIHSSNATTNVSRKFLADAFLKKTTRWDNGDVIRPADQGPDSPVRRKFSEDILRRSVAAVRSYWQQVIFSGRDVPPPEFNSDEEVVRYVLKHSGAVGYVTGGTNIGGAKMVSVY